MKRVLILGAVVLLVAGCAKQPGAITPVSMGNTYSRIPCGQAKSLYAEEAAKVPALVAAQKNAVAGDAVGVFLVGVPFSSLSGNDREGEIAVTKGKLTALGARLQACGIDPVPVTWK